MAYDAVAIQAAKKYTDTKAQSNIIVVAGTLTVRPPVPAGYVALWIASDYPVNALPGDIFLNGPDA